MQTRIHPGEMSGVYGVKCASVPCPPWKMCSWDRKVRDIISGLDSASCTSYLFAFLSQIFFFLNANWLFSYEQSFKTNSHDDDGDDECVTPGNKLINFWNIFQHFLYKYKSTVKRHWDEHDNK